MPDDSSNSTRLLEHVLGKVLAYMSKALYETGRLCVSTERASLNHYPIGVEHITDHCMVTEAGIATSLQHAYHLPSTREISASVIA